MKVMNNNEIIMVDDEESEIYIASRYLKKYKLKNPFLSFNSGSDFLNYLESVKMGIKPIPALVLLDLRMPLMDGFQVLSKVREEPMFDENPIMIIFSNSNDEEDINKAMELKADGYQIKPSGSEEYIRFFNFLMIGEAVSTRSHMG